MLSSSSEFENIDDKNGRETNSRRKKAGVLVIALLVLSCAFLVLGRGVDGEKDTAHTSTLKLAQMQETLTSYTCPPGTVQTGTDSTGRCVCEKCEAGNFCAGAEAPQVQCAEGTYQALVGQERCVDADPGHFAPGLGNQAQQPCLAGTYQAHPARGSCDPAERGYKVPNDGSSTQMPCDPGQFQRNAMQTSCDDSPIGHFATGPAAVIPEPCLPGTYQDATGQAACKDADVGHFVATGGSSSQTPCHYGTYAPGRQSFECESAAAGYHVPMIGSAGETACAPLFFQPCTAQKECIECPAGSIDTGAGQTKCTMAERYLLSQTKMIYSEAQAFCLKHKMHVAQAITPAQQTQFLEICPSICWLGMARDTNIAASGNNFRWDSGPVVGQGLFGANEPNNAGGHENCGETIIVDPTGTPSQHWNDIPCGLHDRGFALCQI